MPADETSPLLSNGTTDHSPPQTYTSDQNNLVEDSAQSEEGLQETSAVKIAPIVSSDRLLDALGRVTT
jgi:hypothetical protein